MENPAYIMGIDLGTTNSLVAVWRDGKAELIPNALGGVLTPSVVGLDNEGRVLVGQAARERLLTHPQLTAAVFKRYMGSQREFMLGRRQFRAEELSALVLGSLKADAERHLGAAVTRAVITVPAYFSDAQRKATRIAGELAGLQVECLLNEPTAAALAYGLHEANPESKFLVFDLGGGTFDVSILELFEGVMEVRASGGDNFLGGEDFVQVLVEAFWKEMAGQQLPDRDHPVLQASLRRQAELVKRQLGEAGRAELKLDWAGKSYVWTVTDDQFQRLAEPLMTRLHGPVERALRDARLRASDLDQVVLVGGATRMPLVRKLVARMFGRMPCMNLNPDEAIALGAAVQAGLKARDAALSEIVMTDVCPYTLGISISQRLENNEVLGGRYLPIIERNTVVPVSREQSVFSMHDNQRLVKVEIYQGEARLVKDNIFLGAIDVPMPPRKAGARLDVRFTYDINGLLEAEMTVAETGAKHQLVIEENPGVLTPEQVQERLLALQSLKVHPRDDMVNTALLARAERLYEESLGDIRHYVANLITEFERLLATQDLNLINAQRSQFEERLNQIDGGVL